MLTFDFDAKALTDQIDALKVKAETAIRPAAQAGAQVFYEAVLDTVPVSKKGHWFQGSTAKGKKSPGAKRKASYWFESGSLKGAVYQVYSKSDSSKDMSIYHVAWNHRKVPYGFMVALGTAGGAKANDFIGRAEKTVKQRAIDAMSKEFDQRMKTS
jgi:hypothetical protein